MASLWHVWSLVAPPPAHFNAFLLLCCWCLWKHRHDVVFHSLPHAMMGSSWDVAKMPNSGLVDYSLVDCDVALVRVVIFSPPPRVVLFVIDM